MSEVNNDALVLGALKDYEKAQSSATSGNNNNKGKYLITSIGKDEPIGTEMTKTIRVIPMTIDGEQKMFDTAYFHSIQVGGSKGQWRKIYDPEKNDGGSSPLTDAARAIFEEAKKTTNDDVKKQLNKKGGQYLPKMFYIFKLIERGSEADGPKFWRFNQNSMGEGVMDKIIPIIKKLMEQGKANIHDYRNGRDLTITFKKVKGNNGSPYTKVTSILAEDPTLLTSDKEMAESIVNDKTTWKDVYKRYPVSFLRIVTEGKIPTWDKSKEDYVAKVETFGNPNDINVVSAQDASGVSQPKPETVVTTPAPTAEQPTPPTTPAVTEGSTTTENASDELDGKIDDDDLPF